jgi:omega-amidase
MSSKFKLAVCQMQVVADKKENISKALSLIDKAVEGGAGAVALPEMFNCPYDNKFFRQYAETAENSETIEAIAKAAAKHGIYIFGGSIPELADGEVFNTCFVFDRNGRIIGRHRKVHLFDINVTGRITFKESDVLSAGNELTVIKTDLCCFGVAICYDMRFPELFQLMQQQGSEVVVIPAAFNMVTGPAHWELLIRCRALDNQVYVAAAAPARCETASYVAYGNSMIVGPWGEVITRADEKEAIIFAEIDLARKREIHDELPVLKQRRTDLYTITIKKQMRPISAS